MIYLKNPFAKVTFKAVFSCLLLSCSMLFLISCRDDDGPIPEPEADFTSIANELNVSFTNTSINANNFVWDFGDGNTSNDSDPMHTYASAGIYQVTLIASISNLSDTIQQFVNAALEGVTPTTSFTFEIVSEGEITFINESVNGTAFRWDFGDGTTSNELVPTHNYRESATYEVVLTALNGDLNGSFEESLEVAIAPENERLISGFVILGVTEDGSARFGNHFDELPTGTVNLNQGVSFQRFFPLSLIDGAIFAARTDGSSGFERLFVNGNGEFIQDGFIATINVESFQIAARNNNIGVFHDRNSADIIQTFDPSTMTVTGTLDMSLANAAIPDEPVRYQQFIFRNDDEFFAPMRTEDGGNVVDAALPVVSISQGGVQDVAMFEGLGEVIYFNGSRRLIDEDGNLYFWHAGNLSVPTISGSVLKIPAGTTDYDPEYNFKIPEINNPNLQGLGTFMTGFNYWKDNEAFALVNEALDPALLELINDRGGIQNFTEDDLNLALALLFNSPTGAFVLVNVETQQVTRVNGLPAVSVFAQGATTYFIDDEPFFGIVTPTENALYSYDETTNTATKVFDATGVQLADIFRLSDDF